MEKKQKLLLAGVIVFMVLIYFLYRPSETNLMKEKEEDHQTETTKENDDDIDLIDYFNMKSENQELKGEIDSLKSGIFELAKSIVDPESNDIYDSIHSKVILYKAVVENKIIILREENDDFINGYSLSITTKEKSISNTINKMGVDEVINYTGIDGLYSGLFDGNVIRDVMVEVNDKSYEVEIVHVADNLSFWYVMYDYKKKSTFDTPDKIQIKALDDLGEVLWEESFDGYWGG